MSYNTETVNSKPASLMRLGDTSELNSLTPSASDYLSYNGSSWTIINTPISSDETGAGIHYTTRTSIGVGYPVNTYNTSTRPFITMYHYGNIDSSTNSTSGNSIAYNYGNGSSLSSSTGLFVEAGTYLCKYSLVTESMSNTAECVFRFCTGSFSSGTATTSNTTFVGPKFYHSPKSGMFNTHPTCVITVSQTSFIGLRCVSSTDMHISLPGPNRFYNFQYSIHAEKIA